MAFISIPDSWIQVGTALMQRLFQRIKDDLDSLFSSVGVLQGADILNGFFEVVEDITAIKLRPASWTVIEYLGGTVELDDANSRKAQYALKFNHPGGGGNGGGEAESDYFPVNPDLPDILETEFWSTLAGVRIKITVDYFDEDKVFIIASTQTLYNVNAANPTSPTVFEFALVPVATARYMKVKFIMGDTDTDPGASANIFLDAVRALDKRPFAAGDIEVSDPISNNTTSAVLLPMAEWRLDRPGTLRVKYLLKHGPAGGGGIGVAWGEVYINGVAVAGTSVSTGTSVAVSQDIPGINKDDVIAIYARDAGASVGVYVDDGQLFADQSIGTYDLP